MNFFETALAIFVGVFFAEYLHSMLSEPSGCQCNNKEMFAAMYLQAPPADTTRREIPVNTRKTSRY